MEIICIAFLELNGLFKNNMNGWSEPPHFTGVHMDDGAWANAPIWVSKREFSFKIAEFEKKLGKVMYILVQSDLNLERKKNWVGGIICRN